MKSTIEVVVGKTPQFASSENEQTHAHRDMGTVRASVGRLEVMISV